METMRMRLPEEVRYPHNAGQEAERVFRYTMTGRLEHADHYRGPDCLDIQVKSSKSTICQGLDIRAHVASDTARRYAYVLADKSLAYIMSPREWVEFVDLFTYPSVESGKNGGKVKLRLKTENKAMRAWLEARTLKTWSIDYNGRAYEVEARTYEEAEQEACELGLYLGDCIIEECEVWG